MVFREAVEAGVDDALNRASSFLLFSYGATDSQHSPSTLGLEFLTPPPPLSRHLHTHTVQA